MATEQEFEIIPVTLGASSMLRQVMEWRNFFLTLAVEHAAKTDGIDTRQGWKIDLATGVWKRPKEKTNAAPGDEDATKIEGGQSNNG